MTARVAVQLRLRTGFVEKRRCLCALPHGSLAGPGEGVDVPELGELLPQCDREVLKVGLD